MALSDSSVWPDLLGRRYLWIPRARGSASALMLLPDPQLEAKARIQFEEVRRSMDAAATSSTATTRCSRRR